MKWKVISATAIVLGVYLFAMAVPKPNFNGAWVIEGTGNHAGNEEVDFYRDWRANDRALCRWAKRLVRSQTDLYEEIV
jgi:hypothetical protein